MMNYVSSFFGGAKDDQKKEHEDPEKAMQE